MLDIHIPSLREYDVTTARQLSENIKNLRNFDDIAQWDKRANAEVDNMRAGLKSLEDQQQRVSQALEQAKRDYQGKPFLARLIASRKEENRLVAEMSRLANIKIQLEELIDQFEAAIDFTPDSPEDLKELIKECRQRKKELQADKKAVGAQMTAIRVEARQQTTKATPGKYGKWDRRQIRLNKEAALQPHENEKAAIDRQIIKLDRILAWLERFK